MDVEHLGPYQIVGQLGRGGMGTVYEGVHRETGEPAAVKLLSAALAQEEDFRVRFEAEIEALRKLNHPNIVRLFGFGEQEGRLFYAMELVDGNSLEEELQRGRRFDWREVARIGIETCRALQHAHNRGIIHRDIKPGNLLLAVDGRVKLSDFGIARLFGRTHLTIAGNVVGTAEYMAPEQAEGRPVDPRADLYSLGALLYSLLARRPVFRGKSLPEVLHKQRFEEPEPLRKHAADAPEELERILGQLLAKDPDRRIPNAGIVGRRLEAMLQSLSVNKETIEAEAGWFVPPEPAAASQPNPSPQEAPAAGAVGQPGDDLPLLELPQQPAAGLRETEVKQVLPEQKSAETAGVSSAGGHFTVVGKDELDQAEMEEPWQAIISWQTWALVAALVCVGLSVWWFLQPPTADALYNQIVAGPADESRASFLQAQSDIHEFLSRYSDDARAARLRDYQKDIDLRLLEWELGQHIKGRPTKETLLPIEQDYLAAVGYLRFDPARGMAKLQALVDLYDRPGDDSGPTGQCLTLARRRLAQLRKEANEHAAEQLPLLRERLDAADALRQSKPARAEAMYRAVVELYGDKPWAAEAVRRARQRLPPSPQTPPQPKQSPVK